MPVGPQGQKRPADAIGLAVMVGRIATGEIGEDGYAASSNQIGRAGGEARSRALSATRRREIAKAGAEARWKERSVL